MQKEITQKQLREVLLSFKGAKIATIITETVPDMKKTKNPYYGDVVKLTRANVMINTSYSNAIAKKAATQLDPALAKKMQPVVQPRTWGKRVDNTCFITHKDNTYLELRFNSKNPKVVYLNNNTGNEIESDLITPFLTKSAAQVIPVCTVNLDNIRGLIVDKTEYIVKAKN